MFGMEMRVVRYRGNFSLVFSGEGEPQQITRHYAIEFYMSCFESPGALFRKRVYSEFLKQGAVGMSLHDLNEIVVDDQTQSAHRLFELQGKQAEECVMSSAVIALNVFC